MDPEAATIWSDPDTPAVCLLALGVDRYPETDGSRLLCLNWLPETWRDEIRDECGRDPHPRCLTRLGAALGLLNNPDDYYATTSGFADVCSGLASDWFDSSTDHLLNTDELLRGLVEAHLIHPPDDGEEFSLSVIRYVNWVVRNDGFAKLPDAFHAFGIPTDPQFDWGHDLSGDPDLAGIAAQGDQDRQDDLIASFHDYLSFVADRLEQLPLRHLNAKSIAADIRSRIPGVPTR